MTTACGISDPRAARAAPTYLAQPADPLLRTRLAVMPPEEAVVAILGWQPPLRGGRLPHWPAGRPSKIVSRW